MKKTTYVIIQSVDPAEDTWRFHGTSDASSAKGAIRAANHGEGTFVAVPLRSWVPLTVKSETVTKITIG